MPNTAVIVPSHITVDENGVARIDGTRMKVVHIVMEKMARGSDPEQMHEAFPDLTLSQIYAALAYYYDNQVEIDEQIVRGEKEAEALLAGLDETPGRKKLRDLGLLP